MFTLKLPNSLTTIGAAAFSNCYRLTDIALPDGVARIESDTFEGCYGLQNVKLPANLTNIGEDAFKGCNALTEITIPKSAKDIEKAAFEDCSNLTSITVQSATAEIGEYAFGYLTDGKSVPERTVTDLVIVGYDGSTAQTYAEDNGFQFVSIGPVGETAAGGTCGKRVYWRLTLDGELIIYGEGPMADYDDGSLPPWNAHREGIKTVNIQEGVTAVGKGAFQDCTALTSVTIPNSVQSIGDQAFLSCSGLAEVTVDPEATNTEHLRQSGSTATIHAMGDLKDFRNLYVDNERVDPANYDLKEGSTVITLPAAFLDTLSAGQHSAMLLFTNGIATTTITIHEQDPETNPPPDETANEPQPSQPDTDANVQDAPAQVITIPQTRDEGPLMVWSVLLLASVLSLAVLAVYRRGRQR